MILERLNIDEHLAKAPPGRVRANGRTVHGGAISVLRESCGIRPERRVPRPIRLSGKPCLVEAHRCGFGEPTIRWGRSLILRRLWFDSHGLPLRRIGRGTHPLVHPRLRSCATVRKRRIPQLSRRTATSARPLALTLPGGASVGNAPAFAGRCIAWTETPSAAGSHSPG